MVLVWIVGAVAAAGLALTTYDLARSATYRRIAVRSIVRRSGETALVVVGSMFGTAIIAAALIVGDSFDGSIRDVARTELGPVDIVASYQPGVDGRRAALSLEDRLSHSGVDHVDGMLAATRAPVVVDNGRRGERQRIHPRACAVEIDLSQGRRFGPEPIDGLDDAGSTPDVGETIVGRDAAGLLDVAAGDDLLVHVYGQTERLRVRDVVPTVGLVGFCELLISPGTLDRLWSSRPDAPAHAPGPAIGEGPEALVLVSLDGGVFDSTTHSNAATRATRAIRAATRDAGLDDVEVTPVKARRIESAERNGSQLRSIFGGIGGFSVISGVLLLVNLVVMLAEERKVEMGLLRAVGFRRSHLLRSFSLEGSLYAIAAAVLGAAVGVLVALAVIAGTQQIFAEPNSTFQIGLHVRGPTLLVATGAGYAISIVTVWLASARVARLNIIAAVRDLPEPRRAHRHLGRILLASTGIAVGGLLSTVGVTGGAQIPLLAGVPVAAFSAIALVSQIERSTTRAVRTASFVGPLAAIVWTLGVFTFFPDEMDHAGIAVFVVMGLLLVAAAVIIAVAFAPLWGRAASARGGSFALSCRLGFAYPLARSIRTGLILGMFSLVIFTMAFMASLAATIDDSAATAARDLDAGFDILVDATASNPLGVDRLRSEPGVADAAVLERASPEFTIRYRRSPTRWAVSGYDEDFLAHGVPRLASRLERFDDDRAVFEEMLRDPTLIVVDDVFLLRGGGPQPDGPEPGDLVELTSPDGERRQLTVAGVLRSDAIFQGSLWPRTALVEAMGPATRPARAFLKVADGSTGAEADRVVRRLAARTATEGTEVRTFERVVADELGETTSFMRLLQGYLGFGLLIGIAGLGVVMMRAARERRHEIGTLRAMGLHGRVIARAFLVEALFIAGGGVLIGVTLGVVTAYQVVVNSAAFSLSSDTFTVAWLPLAVIAVVPVVCAAIAAAQPARAVSRIRPAVALRIAD